MEKAVERNMRERIDRAGMQDKFGRILVPTEEVVELKNGKKRVTERRFFPGYVLVEMVMDDESWHLVKHTSKVTGFVGGARNRPAPISEAEVEKIATRCWKAWTSRVPRSSGPWAKWCASRKARSPTSTGRRRRQLRQEQGRSRRHDFRPLATCGARLRAGRETWSQLCAGQRRKAFKAGAAIAVTSEAEVDGESAQADV
jgi:transcription antitermination factor NusG